MAHSNSTTNYALPQFVSTDKPAWLTDVNTAYSDIDTGMHNAQVAADNAQADATQALTDSGAAMTTASTADAKASGAVASIASTFDATSTYNVGDVVIYNNLLYICSVDIVNPGPWSGSANWDRTTIEDLLGSIDDEITTINGNITTLGNNITTVSNSIAFKNSDIVTYNGLYTTNSTGVLDSSNIVTDGISIADYVVLSATVSNNSLLVLTATYSGRYLFVCKNRDDMSATGSYEMRFDIVLAHR